MTREETHDEAARRAGSAPGGPPTDDAGVAVEAELEAALAALSEPRGGEGEIWKEALRVSEGGKSGNGRNAARMGNGIRWSMPLRAKHVWAVAAMLVFVSAATMLMLPSLGKSPRGGFVTNSSAPMAAAAELKAEIPEGMRYSRSGESGLEDAKADALSHEAAAKSAPGSPVGPDDSPKPQPSADGGRHVIRKATIEITTKDVAAAFSKVSLILNDSMGEYIERSSLTGNAPGNSGEIVLRVAVSRLGTVLNQVRELGKVTAENAGGDDVTDRIVDLDARLRNERRIESELVKLLDTRTNSPLDEVLRLRQELSKVRLGIEQLEGQKQQLTRAVALATVLVILRPEAKSAEPEPAKTGLGEYFGNAISKSWTRGVKGLADSASGFVENLVAGLVWWLILAFVFVLIVAGLRRAYYAAACEPAPRC